MNKQDAARDTLRATPLLRRGLERDVSSEPNAIEGRRERQLDVVKSRLCATDIGRTAD
jgi:hypothetical protein